jgi:putative ATP-dependent endonuclease of OLD family
VKNLKSTLKIVGGNMYISKVIIRNFRVFDKDGITATFKKGVNAIIGENNCGKSAFIDALRLAFSATSYRKDIYFSLSDFHVDNRGVRSDQAIFDIYLDEVPPDLFEIWNPEDNTKGEFHVRYYTIQTTDGKEKIRYQIWGGPVEGNSISAETFEAIQISYLGALRDAESELKPARSGRLAKLFGSIVNTDEAKEQVLAAAKLANSNIETQQSVSQLRDIINNNLSVLEQDLLRQKVGVGLVEPKFESIAASLKAWLRPRWIYIKNGDPILQQVKELYSKDEWNQATDSIPEGIYVDAWTLEKKKLPKEIKEALSSELDEKFEIMQNGLGYNNLLFMATVLGDIKATTTETLFNLLLVEEPEAHLHPQLQELVHSFFETNSNKDNVQIIYTSHSPTLISRIELDKIVLLFENAHRINCLSLSESSLNNKDKYYLERYLDVTKSQMLFAKGIIFVEGICEALLLPCLAKLINRPLDEFAVTVVNVDGVSFEPFSKLLCFANDPQRQTIKTAIITDDDRCADKANQVQYISKDIDYDCTQEELDTVISRLSNGSPSDRYNKIVGLCRMAHINVFGAPKTLEYALSLSESNIPYMLSAILDAYPQAGKMLFNKIESLNSIFAKAACIWLFIRERSKQKAEVAQALTKRIIDKKIILRKADGSFENIDSGVKFEVPEYIQSAIYSVTKEKTDGNINR